MRSNIFREIGVFGTRLEVLKKLLDRVRFQTAHFNGISKADDQELFEKLDATEFIKEKTRCYVESWIVPVILALIKEEETKLNKRSK